MNPVNIPAEPTAPVQCSAVHCSLEIKLQIEVSTSVSSSTERSQAERVETQRRVNYGWCAGFLDGEGCISLAHIRWTCGNCINYRARVNITKTALKRSRRSASGWARTASSPNSRNQNTVWAR